MRSATRFSLAAALLLGAPLALSAEHAVEPGVPAVDAAEDARWLPWIGCWEGLEAASGEGDADALTVCFQFTGNGDEVEITTMASGELVAREYVSGDGVPVATEDGGCEGERWATWSDDGRRLFLRSEMACGEAVTRSTRGVLAIQDEGRQWVEIHAVESSGGEPLVGVRTFVPAQDATVERLGITPPDQGRRLAVSTARAVAARALEPLAIAEAVEEAGAEVTNALIIEAGQPFRLDAATLRSMRDAGVPDEVIDVVVAVTFPERFAIEGSTQDPQYRPDAARVSQRPATAHFGMPIFYGRGYSPYRLGYYDPYFSGLAGGWGWGSHFGTRVVIVQSPTVVDRGRMVRGQGYRAPAASNRGARSAGSAQPMVPTTQVSPPSTGSSPPPRATPRTPDTNPPPPRRAIPRPPPNNGGGGGGSLF